MLSRGIRAASALLLGAGLLLAGCGGDDDAPRPASPTSETSRSTPPTPPATGDSAEEQENRVVDVVRAYWRERVRVETSGDYDSADFGDVMTPQAAEPTLERYAQLGTGGFRRVGEPRLRDFTATVDGRTAVATVCVNEDDWSARADAEEIELEPAGWYAESFRLERTDDRWIIAGDAETPDTNAC